MELRPWTSTGGHGDEIERGLGGFGRGAHNGAGDEVGEAGDGPERRQTTPDDDDVRDENILDGEHTGRPSSIWCSEWTESTVAVLLDIFSGDGERVGHGVQEEAAMAARMRARERERWSRGKTSVLGFVSGIKGDLILRWARVDDRHGSIQVVDGARTSSCAMASVFLCSVREEGEGP